MNPRLSRLPMHQKPTPEYCTYLHAPHMNLATMIMCGLLIIWRLCSRYICRLFGRFLGRRLVHRFFLFIIATLPSKTSSGFPPELPPRWRPPIVDMLFLRRIRRGGEVDGFMRSGTWRACGKLWTLKNVLLSRVETRLIVASVAKLQLSYSAIR